MFYGIAMPFRTLNRGDHTRRAGDAIAFSCVNATYCVANRGEFVLGEITDIACLYSA